MTSHFFLSGQFHWRFGPLLLLCLAVTACGNTKVLENVKYKDIEVPDGMFQCAGKPAIPTMDQLSGPDGDNVFASYVARLESARKDCECAVHELKSFVKKTPVPLSCQYEDKRSEQ